MGEKQNEVVKEIPLSDIMKFWGMEYPLIKNKDALRKGGASIT